METNKDGTAKPFDAATGSAAVCDNNLPPLGEIVWLHDGNRTWIGGRDDIGDGWLWGNTYGSVWHNGVKWDGDLETDDDYKPTHWMRLPEPPNAAGELRPPGKKP